MSALIQEAFRAIQAGRELQKLEDMPTGHGH